jgi:hypothetical protein
MVISKSAIHHLEITNLTILLCLNVIRFIQFVMVINTIPTDYNLRRLFYDY